MVEAILQKSGQNLRIARRERESLRRPCFCWTKSCLEKIFETDTESPRRQNLSYRPVLSSPRPSNHRLLTFWVFSGSRAPAGYVESEEAGYCRTGTGRRKLKKGSQMKEETT